LLVRRWLPLGLAGSAAPGEDDDGGLDEDVLAQGIGGAAKRAAVVLVKGEVHNRPFP
jgi:hypothetical protein